MAHPKPDVQIFFQKLCGLQEGDKFWDWCKEAKFDKVIRTTCSLDDKVACKVNMRFVNKSTLAYDEDCDLGSGKHVLDNKTVRLNNDYEEIRVFCDQVLHPVSKLPLWLVLLIVFIVVSAVSVSAYLFWKRWLRKRIYPSEDQASTYGSSSALSSTNPSNVNHSSYKGSAHSQMPSQQQSSVSKIPSSSRASNVATDRSSSIISASRRSRSLSNSKKMSSTMKNNKGNSDNVIKV